MYGITPHRSRTARSRATARRAALAALGVIVLGAYALALGPQWLLPPLTRPDARVPQAPTSLLVSAAARDLALTPADVAGLPGDVQLAAPDGTGSALSGLGFGDWPGRAGIHAVTFRAAAASAMSVWEPATPPDASLANPPVLEITSAVAVFRDAPTAERALAAWSDRVPSTYRLVDYGPWQLGDMPPATDSPVRAAYGGERPQATVVLVAARAANVLTSVWLAAPGSPESASAATASAPDAAQWQAPLEHAIALSEILVRRSLAQAR
jgi:hypothetical protein